ncbi:MAG: endonuclease domain-containing protein [Synechococcaceae cyanobacterium SM1_2_3]|nr:endonuclease domain-containing protein [Synechococcaceae cyanobacterium SM1_2_3]
MSPRPRAGEGSGRGALNYARDLRSHATEAEQLLWRYLRARRFMGLKFKRQKPMGCFIVDFICLEHRLIIELDGGQHADQMDYDQARTLWLESQGFVVLRFWNHDVMKQLEGVLERIGQAVVAPSPPTPSPASGRGE